MPITSRSFVRATILLLVAGFISVLAIVVAAVWLAERNDRHADDLIDALAARRESFMIQNLVLDAETGQRGYLLTREEAYLEPYRNAVTGIEKQLADLRGLVRTQPQYADGVEQIARAIADKLTELDETIELAQSGRSNEALAMVRTDRGQKAMDSLRTATGSLTTTTDSLVQLYTAELRESAGLLLWVLAAGGFVILGIVGATSWLAWRYTRDLEAARAELIALNASLEVRVRERTADVREQRDRAETLLKEVNHRVGNSLALVGALVRMQSSVLKEPTMSGSWRSDRLFQASHRISRPPCGPREVRITFVSRQTVSRSQPTGPSPWVSL
jgi:CHASE3 domain sensor protein